MTIAISKNDYKQVPSGKSGRPQLNYDEAGPRLKRKLAFELSSEQGHNTEFLVHAATVSAKKSQNIDMAFVLKESLTSPSRPKKIKDTLQFKKPVPLTPDEALAFLLENSLSKQQYINMRLLNKNQNCDIYPSYEKTRESKLKCRPLGITVSETIAQVSLQNLLDHTVQRIMLMQEEVIKNVHIKQMKLIVSYGFDGSTGQSMYKQRFEANAPESLDQSLFVTTLIPLKLVDASENIIWLNQTPQSVRFCRPLKIEFIKESRNLILNEKKNLDDQIRNLIPFKYINTENQIAVEYNLYMTLIDGKVLNILTGTNSSQCCPICGAKPKQFLETKDIRSDVFKEKPGTLQYGVSPLHAWIRFLEFVLKISYRLDIKKWHIRDKTDKETMEKRKKIIQKRLWEEMGLHVDKPKQNGSGNTNDGNTARRAFGNTELFASILQFNLEVLKHFHTILIAISSEFQINAEKFEILCDKSASIYLENYSWYPMSATVHKILVHGSNIIKASVVPVGCLGENAAEARNKLYKNDRNAHARKSSRENNMADVFHRALDSSDPLISTLHQNSRKIHKTQKKIPREVVALLEQPVIISPNMEQIYEDDENPDPGSDNDEYPDGIFHEYSVQLDVDMDEDIE